MELLRDGDVVAAGPWRPSAEGRLRLTAAVPDLQETIDVRVRASDGVDTVLTSTSTMGRATAPEPTASPSPRAAPPPTGEAPGEEGGKAPALVVLGLVAAAMAWLVLTAGRRRRLHRER